MEDAVVLHVPQDVGLKEASRYVQHRAPNLHQAFRSTTPSTYEDQKLQIAPKSGRRRELKYRKNYELLVADRASRFTEVLDIFRKGDDDGAINGFKIREKHTWDEVFQQAKFAESQYKSTNRVRLIFRGIGDHAPGIAPWLGLIPDGEYTSILCGGLKLILKVAERRSEKRLKILTSLEELPQIIAGTQDYQALYHDDETLNDLAIDIYLTLLAVVEGIIKWLTNKAIWKRVQNSVAGSSDSPELDSDLQALTALRINFHGRVEFLTKADVRNATSGIFDMHDDVSNRFDQVEDKLDAQDNLILTLREALRARQWTENRNAYLETLLEKERQKNLLLQQQQHHHPSNALTRHDLLNILSLPSTSTSLSSTSTSANTILTNPPSFSTQTYTRLTSLFSHPLFLRVLQSPDPGIIFLTATLDPTLHPIHISPLTHMLSLLSTTLRAQPRALVLHYTCSQPPSHTHSNTPTYSSPPRTPSTLLRNLIAQLLSLFDFDLLDLAPILHKRSYLNALQRSSPSALFSLFRLLISHVPTYTILFILIDGLALLQNDRNVTDGEGGNQVVDLLRGLRALVRDEEVDAVVKIVLTSANGAREARECMERGEWVEMAEEESHDGDGKGRGRDEWSEREVVGRMRRGRPVGSCPEGAGEGDVGGAFMRLGRGSDGESRVKEGEEGSGRRSG